MHPVGRSHPNPHPISPLLLGDIGWESWDSSGVSITMSGSLEPICLMRDEGRGESVSNGTLAAGEAGMPAGQALYSILRNQHCQASPDTDPQCLSLVLPLPELGNLSPASETIQATTSLLFCSQTRTAHPTRGFPHHPPLLLLNVHLPITERPNQLPEGTPMASETPPV